MASSGGVNGARVDDGAAATNWPLRRDDAGFLASITIGSHATSCMTTRWEDEEQYD